MARTAALTPRHGFSIATGALVLLVTSVTGVSAQAWSPVYHEDSQLIVNRGKQAFMLCNGIFVSGRSVEQIYAEELKLGLMPLLPLEDVTIDVERKAVSVGTGDHRRSADAGSTSFGGLNEGGAWEPGVPVMRAAYREGLGCMTLAPDQTLDEIDELPELVMAPPPGDPSQIPWPDGDLIEDRPLPDYIDETALEAAGEWAFDRATYGHESQITLSLLVVHKGDIVYERYGDGVDMTTRTRTWSTAKSIAVSLIGIAVDEGLLDLDDPLPYDQWQPRGSGVQGVDPRREITLRNVLNMSSGLYPVDNRLCPIIGSCLSYFAGTSSVEGALDRGVVAEPGTVWDYENYDTLLGVLALKTALEDTQTYLEFPRRALLDKIGMRSTLPGVDRFGDYVMSSQVYTNARDLGRFGLLYLNNGVWNGERLLPESWIDFVRTSAPATANSGNFYGGQFWLPSDQRTDVPQDAYTTAGNRGQYATIIPSYDLVIVRRGLDYQPGPGTGFSWEDMVVEVIKAFPDQTSPGKLMAGGQ